MEKLQQFWRTTDRRLLIMRSGAIIGDQPAVFKAARGIARSDHYLAFGVG